MAEFNGEQPDIEEQRAPARSSNATDDRRSRSNKDKNKSRVANHNRKAGHDRKMAKGF
jgi:hypothetical protein